mmetsp:Transcript_23026/g.36860  ORF Transcript_23026/g.36860 Transcript_23026/m.36860 type:complete len:267 (+) Transcript_23026:173-973(+)
MSRAGSVVSLSEVFALRPFSPLPPAPRIMPVVAHDRQHCCRKPKSRQIAMAFLCAADTDAMDCCFAASGIMHILKGASNIVFYLRHCHCVFRFFVFHRSCGWLCRCKSSSSILALNIIQCARNIPHVPLDRLGPVLEIAAFLKAAIEGLDHLKPLVSLLRKVRSVGLQTLDLLLELALCRVDFIHALLHVVRHQIGHGLCGGQRLLAVAVIHALELCLLGAALLDDGRQHGCKPVINAFEASTALTSLLCPLSARYHSPCTVHTRC